LRRGSRDWRRWLIEDKFGQKLRDLSVGIIDEVERGRFLDEAINQHFSASSLSDSQKALIYEICSGVIRWKIWLDWVLSRYVRRETKKDLRHILWITLYQISFMKKAHYHVVKEAVEFVKKKKGREAANFVNGVLRAHIRERDNSEWPLSLEETPLAIRYSFPEWLAARWKKRFGEEETKRLLSLLNRSPEYTVRVDLKRISRDEAKNRLQEEGVGVRDGLFLDSALYVDRLAPVLASDLFREEYITVQDEASQLVGEAVSAERGDRLLDACAGSGTKSQHLTYLYEGVFVVSMDKEMKRLRLAPKDMNSVAADILRLPFGKETFDMVLLDAPCSSLGIIRKHPEIKWLRAQKDIVRFGRQQLELLKGVWGCLKTGGHLVYSVCSFEPEETTEVIERFGDHARFVLEKPLPFLFNKDYFLSVPHETNMDGFFIARLKKI
jgi:16S rRNA (cytosine967-C5)-methyltransferase